MRLILAILFFSGGLGLTSQLSASCDSAYVSSINELKELKDYEVCILAIDFIGGKHFDYSLIPKGLKTLRFLKPCKNLTEAGVLTLGISGLETIELNGKMCEFLPEILYVCKRINRVLLKNTKLSRIWNYTYFLGNHELEYLGLKDFEVDEKCKMYKGLFVGGQIKTTCISFITKRLPSPEEQVLLMEVFQTKNLRINGECQSVYK